MDETFFVYPPRYLWHELGEILGDEDVELDPAEDVFDDVILFEVGE